MTTGLLPPQKDLAGFLFITSELRSYVEPPAPEPPAPGSREAPPAKATVAGPAKRRLPRRPSQVRRRYRRLAEGAMRELAFANDRSSNAPIDADIKPDQDG